MKKAKFLIFPLAAAALTLTACSKNQVNHGPELWGVNDITCLADTTVDLLDGIAALDAEDGDITADLNIIVTPEVPVENGYAVFTEAGEYELCYEIRDGKGKLARTVATATVKERDVFMDNPLVNGFSLKTGGGVRTLNDGLNGGEYSFKVTGNEIAEDVRLSRSFTLNRGTEYAFKYGFNCNLSGRIKIAADGKAFTERFVNAGSNLIEFSYTLAEGETATDTVVIELWLGGLEGDIEFSLSGAETSYLRDGGDWRELASGFSFNGNIINRDDRADAVYASPDGGSATVEIENPTGEIWQVGMFVKTGVRLEAGNQYEISFNIDSKLGNSYQICIQHDQWQDSDAYFVDDAQGFVTRTITATESFSGDLWLFIRSGINKNVLTISDLSVKVKESGQKTESFSIGQAYCNSGNVRCEYGKITYDIQAFGSDWGQNETGTPAFALSGAAGNFVITFKAKATSPVSCVFAASAAGYWDTFAWRQLKLSAEEQTYSIRCDDKSVEGQYKFLWQFGTSANAVYSDVTVEISDIKICYLSELEG